MLSSKHESNINPYLTFNMQILVKLNQISQQISIELSNIFAYLAILNKVSCLKLMLDKL